MSETVTMVAKLVAGLASPKASLKYFLVGIGIMISWKYFYPAVVYMGVTEEHQKIVVLLLGIGMGSFVGHYIGNMIFFFWDRYEKKKLYESEMKTLKIKEEKEKLDSEKERLRFVRLFKKSFAYLTPYQRNVLRALTKGEDTHDVEWEGIKSLCDNKYMQALSNIDNKVFLFQINPLIKDYVIEFYAEIVERTTKDFLSADEKEWNRILSLLEDKNRKKPLSFSKDLIEICYHPMVSVCISIQDDFGDRGIYFNEDYREEFEKQTDKSYLDEISFNNSQFKKRRYLHD